MANIVDAEDGIAGQEFDDGAGNEDIERFIGSGGDELVDEEDVDGEDLFGDNMERLAHTILNVIVCG